MDEPIYRSYVDWVTRGSIAKYVFVRKSGSRKLDMMEAIIPGGSFSRAALPDLVLYQDMKGGSRICGDLGGGRFDVTSVKGAFFLAPPNVGNTLMIDSKHQVRALSFPVAQWQTVLDGAAGSRISLDDLQLYRGLFQAPTIQSAFRHLWALCDEEGAPSRLLAQAAGCEILAELCRLSGTPFSPARGGLAPRIERRCRDLMQARLSEDISLDELAAEAGLSPFHFARMFKQSVGVPPRVYLTRLRLERACALLEATDLPITEIALDVGYSSSQVLARVFLKHRHMSPTDYRRAVHDPLSPNASIAENLAR